MRRSVPQYFGGGQGPGQGPGQGGDGATITGAAGTSIVETGLLFTLVDSEGFFPKFIGSRGVSGDRIVSAGFSDGSAAGRRGAASEVETPDPDVLGAAFFDDPLLDGASGTDSGGVGTEEDEIDGGATATAGGDTCGGSSGDFDIGGGETGGGAGTASDGVGGPETGGAGAADVGGPGSGGTEADGAEGTAGGGSPEIAGRGVSGGGSGEKPICRFDA